MFNHEKMAVEIEGSLTKLLCKIIAFLKCKIIEFLKRKIQWVYIYATEHNLLCEFVSRKI